MKVESLETFVLRAAPAEVYWGARAWSADHGATTSSYPPEARRRCVYSPTIDTVLVRVRTGDGAVGWGECKAPVAADSTAGLVEELLTPIVVGTRLDEIAVTWERMYTAMRVRGHASGFWMEALSGVDIALWDAWARWLDRPLHHLLGGAFRNAVPVYASGIPAASAGTSEEGLHQVRQEARRLVESGFTAIKVAIGAEPDRDIASVAAVRDELGPGGQVYADAAGAYDVAQALRVGRGLEDLGAGFFEMPIPPENVEGYAALARRLDVPLALDSLTNRYQALEFLRTGGLHVLQPDVCRAGGITELMRIAVLADAFGAIATPHVSIGSAVHFAASLQCASAIPNLHVMEHWIGDNPIGRAIAPDLDGPVEGLRRLPSGPGLGINVDHAAVEQLAAAATRRSAHHSHDH